MLDKIIQFSIKNKLMIGIMIVALIGWGTYSLNQLPIDAVPDITNNQVQIITVSPSNGAEDIERFVTFPVEQTMATIPNIEEVRSFSRFGLSVVTVVFKEDVDVYWARQQVSERLNDASKTIPQGMGTPEMAPVTTGLGEIYQYVIHTKKGYEDKYDATELRTIQDWIVRRQLLGVEGVADVSSFGGFLKQYEIALDPDKLKSMNVGVNDVFTALQKNNQNTGGAYIDKKPNAYFIRSEGLIQSINDIEEIVVTTHDDGIPVLIRNVAEVKFGAATRYGAMTRNNDGEVVGAIVMMLKGANSSKVIADVKERMAQIEKTLPEGIVVEPFLDRTKLVNNAIGTVAKNLAEGALIVIFVLVLLLGNFRAGLIVASVIPLAMLFAISLMNLFGVSGNLMSLGAIDFGLIVDGAVIIVEATLHHLQHRNKRTKLSQLEMDQEVYTSASKIRNSAAFGEIIILIVYLPILALVGVEGKMFKPMAQTVVFAILGAFLLSLTYVPMMSALFLSKKISLKRTISDRIIEGCQRAYAPMLRFALKTKVVVVGIAVGLFFFCLFLFSSMGSEFIPTLEEGDFAVETRVLTGSSLSQTIEAATRAGKVLKENFPEVKEVVGKIGSGEIPTDPMPVEACDLMVILKDKSEWTSASTREELAEKMQAELEKHIPGVTFGFQQPIQMRFNELMTGARQDVVIKIYGEDLDKLSKYAKQIGAISQQIEGAQDVYVEQVSGLPQIVIEFKRDKIAQFGLNIEDINTAIRAGFAGEVAGLVFEGEKRFDMVVRLDKVNRQNLDDVRNLFIESPTGAQIPLEQLATIDFKEGPNQIQRDDAKRRIIVGFNVRGRDVESIVEEIQKKVDTEVKFEAGYYPTYGGTFENLQAATARLSIAVPVALLLIFFLLYLTFKSAKQALLIFTAIPLSAIGGVFALWMRGMPFSISAGVGFIALFGVAVLNGIVLIAEFNRLKKEGMKDTVEIIKTGTAVRLRPVIMTALVASLGFLPMALSNGSGAEVQKPLATVVIGGLLTATLLTLLVLPILYYWFEKMKPKVKSVPTVTTVITLLLLSGFGYSQGKTVTLDQAIEAGLTNNKGVIAGNQQVEFQTQYKQTLFEIPKTDVNLMVGQYNSINRSDNNLSISQTIPFPTVFSANSELGNVLIEQSKLKTELTKNELVHQIKQCYFYLQYLHEEQKILIAQDSVFKGFVESSSLREKTGEGTLLEKTTAQTQANEIGNRLAQNKANQSRYLLLLQNLIGSREPISIAETELKEQQLLLASDSNAVAENPELAYIQQQIEVTQSQRKVEIAKGLPDITLGYFNQTLIGTQNVNNQDVYFDGSKRFQGFQVGLAVPLFFNGYSAKVKSANLSTKVAESNLEAYQADLQGKYQQALQEYLNNRNSLEYYKQSALGNAESILLSGQKGYAGGEISYSEYLFSLKTANEIKERYLAILLQTNLSAAKLQYLTGKK
ncbi:MAG: acriflavine resistance protein B [Candidatus Fluviicola riflensis]|nr:MAG: CusA/CzcA family heavy metal efflux RND transporter [Candidatus Fluviicola riflensis]OGS77806.1 MAG: acriflavine resistance protein B [Candidatus Fluviicola riflensis]OGS84871.1 MAG: acriflavine resistance protein B [Fluviicola sp. RIFCSPHIGHO2_01_FULL_43_53]OGS89143.1 MAG: acriflavine resistance protein B [Fluviicola sp. RIFCSPHIGHO2_12_FULL_43_24]